MDRASYIVLIKPDPSGGFVAEVPDLPGCVSEGETIPETLSNIQEAIVGVLELRHELGLPDRDASENQGRKRVIKFWASGAGGRKRVSRPQKGVMRRKVTVTVPA